MSKIRIRQNAHSTRLWRCQANMLYSLALFMIVCLAWAVPSGATSKLYPPDKDEAGALRLAQVNRVASRDEILRAGVSLQHILASGVKESDLKDGSLASGRVYCCHPSTDVGTETWFYVPPDVSVSLGDIVAVRMGREATKKDPGTVNVAVEVREKSGAPDSKCSWDPPNERLWRRVLYCSWMQTEGWTLKNGSHKTWLKRPSDAKPQ